MRHHYRAKSSKFAALLQQVRQIVPQIGYLAQEMETRRGNARRRVDDAMKKLRSWRPALPHMVAQRLAVGAIRPGLGRPLIAHADILKQMR
ncbi:MAG: hypothetical protein KA156_05875, partial [Paracoccus sp.]|nr:hypothetical protein [Paracoccus sp. (in: a-proteobacteria)]